MSDTKGRESPPAKFQKCGRKPWRGDTPYAREPLTMSKIKNYSDFWFPYKNCRGGQIPCELTVHCRGLWLAYKNYCGDQLPCNNYRALPWWLATVQSIPWLPITVHRLRGSTIGEGGDTSISSSGRSTKQPLPGIGLHDPLHGRQACPEFIAFD